MTNSQYRHGAPFSLDTPALNTEGDWNHDY